MKLKAINGFIYSFINKSFDIVMEALINYSLILGKWELLVSLKIISILIIFKRLFENSWMNGISLREKHILIVQSQWVDK